jgi:apolipoprotein N-acyltransferase
VLWVLVWLVLLLAAAGAFFLLGRHLWRKARALTRELGVATDRLTEVTDRLAELSHPPRPGETNRR